MKKLERRATKKRLRPKLRLRPDNLKTEEFAKEPIEKMVKKMEM